MVCKWSTNTWLSAAFIIQLAELHPCSNLIFIYSCATSALWWEKFRAWIGLFTHQGALKKRGGLDLTGDTSEREIVINMLHVTAYFCIPSNSRCSGGSGVSSRDGAVHQTNTQWQPRKRQLKCRGGILSAENLQRRRPACCQWSSRDTLIHVMATNGIANVSS